MAQMADIKGHLSNDGRETDNIYLTGICGGPVRIPLKKEKRAGPLNSMFSGGKKRSSEGRKVKQL